MLWATPKKSSEIHKHSSFGTVMDLPFVRTKRNEAPFAVACRTICLIISGFIVSCLPDRLQFRGWVARVSSQAIRIETDRDGVGEASEETFELKLPRPHTPAK